MIVLPQQWHVGVLLNYHRLVFIRLRLFSSLLIRLPPTRLLSCFFPLHACVKTSISARQDVTRPVAQGDGWEKRAAQIDFDFIPNHPKCLVLMGADQSAVRSTAPGLEISSVIRWSGPVGSTPSLEDGEGHVTSSGELQLKPAVYIRDTVRHKRYPLPHTRGAEIHPLASRAVTSIC